VIKNKAKIKDILEELYGRYGRAELIKPDPLQFVYQYTDPRDMEIAGFLASALAYGRVQQIEKSVTNLLGRMGESPFEFVMDFDKSKRKLLADFKHRFNTGDDISALIQSLQKAISSSGGFEDFFAEGYSSSDENIVPALTSFCGRLIQMNKGKTSHGFKYLLASPAGGSASKRLNLFLRWMVRDEDVDAGLWRSIDKSKLIVPIDVHMGRLCKILGFYERKSIDLKSAVEITESFKQIAPEDPAKYDFPLSRIGILENCTGRLQESCKVCSLFSICSAK
jgi:uncharacterized protein (TIGR02757 family)